MDIDKVSTDRWHYAWYIFATEALGRRIELARGKQNFCVYWRRVLIYAPCIFAVMCVMAGFLMAVAVTMTVIGNLVTIPIGHGVILIWPEKENLQVPFRAKRYLIPFWAIIAVIATVWFGLSYHSKETMATLYWVGTALATGVAGAILLFVGGYMKEKLAKQSDGPVADAWKHVKLYMKAKREKMCPMIEFVSPESE